jgi:hypothetical protein
MPRARYTPADRMLTALAKLVPRARWAAFLITPSTLLRWHRELVAYLWTYPRTGRDKRSVDEEIVAWAGREPHGAFTAENVGRLTGSI